MRKLLVLSAAAAAALAGCGGSTHKSSAPTTASTSLSTTVPPVTVAPATTTPVATTPSTTAPVTTTTAPSGPQPCLTADLAASLGSPNGAAGTVYYDLMLTNKGSAACTLTGYPGVSFVTGSSGTQVGAGAARSNGTAGTVTLASGQAAGAPLGITVASNYGASCQITNVAGLRVYPPGQTAALFVPHTDQGCANQADVVLHIGPLGSPTS